MKAWLASIDPKFDDAFYAKLAAEGYADMYKLHYEYEELEKRPFSLKRGFAKALWTATRTAQRTAQVAKLPRCPGTAEPHRHRGVLRSRAGAHRTTPHTPYTYARTHDTT